MGSQGKEKKTTGVKRKKKDHFSLRNPSSSASTSNSNTDPEKWVSREEHELLQAKVASLDKELQALKELQVPRVSQALCQAPGHDHIRGDAGLL